jgi:16S rRNA (guanine(966)-N(2))-methyltransferase RsmD
VRIISGEYKGRRIPAPKKHLDIRPTTDFAKESLFNIINNYFDFKGLKVLDLFTGSGFISYEFVSRGAKLVNSIDINMDSLNYIHEIIKVLNINNRIIPIYADVYRFLNSCNDNYDIIFADPPFNSDNILVIPEIIFKRKLLNENGWLIVEHSANINFFNNPNFLQHRKYGKVNFSIFAK